jgi:hypothetical protein
MAMSEVLRIAFEAHDAVLDKQPDGDWYVLKLSGTQPQFIRIARNLALLAGLDEIIPKDAPHD